jgi:hypothetical protein
MKRALTAAALAVSTSALGLTPAMAAPPEPADFSGVFEGVCEFPVLVEATGKAKVIEHGDRVLTVGPGQKATLTNTETGESVHYNIAGAFHDAIQPDGSIISKGTGRNLLFTQELGMFLTVGNVQYTVTEDLTAPEGFAITINSVQGKIIDVCEVLA